MFRLLKIKKKLILISGGGGVVSVWQSHNWTERKNSVILTLLILGLNSEKNVLWMPVKDQAFIAALWFKSIKDSQKDEKLYCLWTHKCFTKK